MRKENQHPEMHPVCFTCSSCGNKIELLSTIKDSNYTIDICDKCHPFYIGKATSQQLKGRSEKLANKFNAGMTNMNEPKKEVKKEEPKKESHKKIVSLENL